MMLSSFVTRFTAFLPSLDAIFSPRSMVFIRGFLAPTALCFNGRVITRWTERRFEW
jgi:purine-cytosine permease-like protein